MDPEIDWDEITQSHKQMMRDGLTNRVVPFLIVLGSGSAVVWAFTESSSVWVKVVATVPFVFILWLAIKSVYLAGMAAAYTDASERAKVLVGDIQEIREGVEEVQDMLRVVGPS